MQDKQQSYIYFENRDPTYENQCEIKTYRYVAEYIPNKDNSTQNLLMEELMSEFIKQQSPEMRFSQFLSEISNACKRVIEKKKQLKSNKNQTKKLIRQLTLNIFYAFIQEFILFLSFIEVHTTFHQRQSEIYNSESKFYIKWEDGVTINKKQGKNSNSQATNQGNSEIINKKSKRMILMPVSNSSKYNNAENNLKERWSTVSGFQIEGQLFEDFLQEYFKNQQDHFSVLKGKNGTFYIILFNDCLGKGGFGEVYRGISLKLNKDKQLEKGTWAIKLCRKHVSEYKEYGYSISQERQHEILMQINKNIKKKELKGSNYIIELKEVLTQKDKKYIIYEYCAHNSLREIMKKNANPFSKKVIYEIALQLASVLRLIHYDLIQSDQEFLRYSVKFSHDQQISEDATIFANVVDSLSKAKGIIHRDLKLNNILVKQYSRHHIIIKVIDWAFSKRTFTDLKINKVFCGTIQYQAPEIEDKKRYCSKVDIWAFGAVMYELLTGKQLVEKNRGKQIKQNIKYYIDNMQFNSAFESISNEQKSFWQGLLLGSLEHDPDKRWSSVEVFNHISAYNHYQQIQLKDLPLICRIKQVKNSLFYRLSIVQNSLKSKTKLNLNACNKYSKFLLEIIQSLCDRHLSTKININKTHVQIAKKQYKSEQFISIIKTGEQLQRIKEATLFFSRNLMEQDGKIELLRCIQFILDQHQRCCPPILQQ